MRFRQVYSSSIRAIGYDKRHQKLGVKFINGSEYLYAGVPKDLYEHLVTSDSVGTFFNAHVRQAGFSCERVQ